ncbi:hypothetical protein ACFFRR_001510 [Megaselia abdita]
MSFYEQLSYDTIFGEIPPGTFPNKTKTLEMFKNDFVKFVDLVDNELGMEEFTKLSIQSILPIHPAGKSNEVSDEFRATANNNFKRMGISSLMEYSAVLNDYTQALFFAEDDNRRAMICGNKSAVFVMCGEKERALANIKLAREYYKPKGKSDEFLEKLAKREEKCRKLPGNIQKAPVPLALTTKDPNPNIPDICIDIKVKTDGKGVFAKKQLKFGDVIATTHPLGSENLGTNKANTITCENCHCDVSYFMVPCHQCSGAVFCGQKCRVEGMDGFHGAICKAVLYFRPINAIEGRIALNIIFKALKSKVDLKRLLYQPSTSVELQNDSMEEKLRVFLGVKCPEMKHEDIYMCAINTAFMRNFLKAPSTFRNMVRSYENGSNLVQELYKRLYSVIKYRFLKFSSTKEVDYLFGLFRHNCKPNVIIERGPSDGIFYIAINDIKEGDELNVAMGNYSYESHNRQNRKKALYNKFVFTCDCKACKRNLTYHEQPPLFVDNEDMELSLLDKLKQYCRKEIADLTKADKFVQCMKMLREATVGKESYRKQIFDLFWTFFACNLDVDLPFK